MNEIKLQGRITRDSSDTDKGQFFTVAYNESYNDKNGNKQQVASFIPVAYRGEKLELKKGDAVQIIGELKTYQKDDQTKFIVNSKDVKVLEVNKKQEQKSEVEQATEGKVSQGVKEEKVENKVKEQPKEKVVKTTKKKGMEI